MNNLILGAIAGIGGLCLIVVMSYESGLHDGKVEMQLEAGKQMVKAKEIDKKNNEIKYKEAESRIHEIKKVESSISNLQIVYKYIPVNTVCKLESQAIIEINNNLRSK
jgi:ABC-type lipoprotein release transport system permease subunit